MPQVPPPGIRGKSFGDIRYFSTSRNSLERMHQNVHHSSKRGWFFPFYWHSSTKQNKLTPTKLLRFKAAWCAFYSKPPFSLIFLTFPALCLLVVAVSVLNHLSRHIGIQSSVWIYFIFLIAVRGEGGTFFYLKHIFLPRPPLHEWLPLRANCCTVGCALDEWVREGSSWVRCA